MAYDRETKILRWEDEESKRLHAPTVSARPASPGARLVVFSSVFNLLLCFVNTRHWASIGNVDISLTELVILAAGTLFIRNKVSKSTLQVAFLITLYLLGIKLMNPNLDLKILHDLAIMYVFYRLGTLASIETGNKILWLVMLMVLALGVVELLLPNIFSSVFDVWSYYVNKGVIGQNVINYAHSNLYLSGSRGSAMTRTFFPGIFGSHRVSSIFLEPDSLGNFAAITFAWCLSTSTGALRSRAALMFLAAFCFVLADSRFASVCCLIMLILRLLPFARSQFVVFLMPIAVMLALTIVGSIWKMPGGGLPMIINDNYPGRVLFSGRLLDYWGLPQWLGLVGSQVYTADTGYAYFVNNLGLPLALFLLALFAATPHSAPEGGTMKLMISVYFATSLCIGAAVFTIKTAALLWFLYGTTKVMSRTRLRPHSEEPARASAQVALGERPLGLPV